MSKLSKKTILQCGSTNIPLIVGLVLMAVSLPLSLRLVQQQQEVRREAAPQMQFGRGDPRSEQEICRAEGGVWRQFTDSCVDSCEKARNPDIGCLTVLTYGCYCGPNECWSIENQRCELISSFGDQPPVVTPRQISCTGVCINQDCSLIGLDFAEGDCQPGLYCCQPKSRNPIWGLFRNWF